MQAVRPVHGDVGDGEREEFTAPAGTGESHQQQGHVPAGGDPGGPHRGRRRDRWSAAIRMSLSSNGDRRPCGVDRIRRIPDSARRTTSARPGAVSPAAVWNWLMLDTHRVSVAGAYRHFPRRRCSVAASVT